LLQLLETIWKDMLCMSQYYQCKKFGQLVYAVLPKIMFVLYKCTHTHKRFTALFDFVGDYPGEPAPISRKVKPIWITGARDSEWQWHQLARHNHVSIPPLSFLQAGCPSCHPTASKH